MPQLAHIIPNQQLQPIDLVAPGFRGLNLNQSGGLLSPAFATEAMNAILDDNGRLAARDGVTNQTSTAISPAVDVKTLFEYRAESGTNQIIVAYDGGISNSIADPEGSDISGAVTDTNGNWWFVNFNNKVIGFQSGLTPIVYTGSGNFATITVNSGTAPNGSIGLAAFGRVWGVASDLQTIRYSALLDETRWAEADGGGTIDMSTVWTQGTDTVTALWAFNGGLVVFGKRHIVFWVDGQGSALGLDPTQMYVVDVVSGTGCVSQWTIQPVGQTDLLYLSSNGVQSIKRIIQEKSSPISTLTKYVRDELLGQLQSETVANIRSTFSPLEGFYLLSFPTNEQTWCLDQSRRYVDDVGEELSVITRWNIAPSAMVTRDNNDLLLAITSGKIGKYSGDQDDGANISFQYKSPWLDLGEEIANRLKILKRLGAILFVRNATTISFKWSVDFDEEFKVIQRTIEGDASAEWGSAEWGEDEWSGGLALRIIKVPARKKGTGQYFRIGIEATVRGELAMQQAELFAKIGRLA